MIVNAVNNFGFVSTKLILECTKRCEIGQQPIEVEIQNHTFIEDSLVFIFYSDDEEIYKYNLESSETPPIFMVCLPINKEYIVEVTNSNK